MYSRIKKYLAFAFKSASILLIAYGCFSLSCEALTGPITTGKFFQLICVAAAMAVTASAIYGPDEEEDEADAV